MITKQKSDIGGLVPFVWVSFLLLVLCIVVLLPLCHLSLLLFLKFSLFFSWFVIAV